MGKSGMLARQKVRDRVIKQAAEQTTRQYMTDMLILTLNDPEVMGKDVFGYERLMRVLKAWGKNYDLYFDAPDQERRSRLCAGEDRPRHPADHRRQGTVLPLRGAVRVPAGNQT